VCSPTGLGIQLFWNHEARRVEASVTLTEAQQGPPGHAHGGISAAIIDEVMGASAWISGHRVVAAHLDFDYLRPVPLGKPLTLQGQVAEIEGKRVLTEGVLLLPDGKPAVKGRGVFVSAPKLFNAEGFGWSLNSE
jgi:uncharacterized protein (TIGR00369 family)